MAKNENINRFKDLTFEDFKCLAKDISLSSCEKTGFPDSYRKGFEKDILNDICKKIPVLKKQKRDILDIGPGCSDLTKLFIQHCVKKEHNLELIDSEEMLSQVPNRKFITKRYGCFPKDFTGYVEDKKDSFDVIISYSVFHYIYREGNIFDFLDCCAYMLKQGGYFLLGDIPNNSKRRRFFSTEAGIKYHQKFTNSDTLPPTFDFELTEHMIDDGVLTGIISRYRNLGFEAYILPQGSNLPFANRREDILIRRN